MSANKGIATATPYWVVAVLLGICVYPVSRDTIGGGETWIDNAAEWLNLPLSIALIAVCLISEYLQRQGRYSALRSLILVPFIAIHARFFVLFLYGQVFLFGVAIVSCLLLITAAILFAQPRPRNFATGLRDRPSSTG
ncbi:hypothetical protein [Rhodococcus sp. HNM0569]|uniref:hypothetical protein n=1 Tax=Rhodococcus sp. HNM0569 TaxID=2716340 RepID=UPI00146D7C3E|nr:hypothetical protein [Rhodococcus sp. HNM0569]NLU82691.1 hypothetical protein [Rhodococcus sp. HNM0569]